MKRKITRLARAGKCGARAASGVRPGGRPGLVGQQRRQGQRAEAGARPPQQLAAARQRRGDGVIHRSTLRGAATTRFNRGRGTRSYTGRSGSIVPRGRPRRPARAVAGRGRSRPAWAAGPGRGRRAGGCGPRSSPGVLARHPRGQGPGLVADERVVQEEEGLRGHDRLAAPGDDRAGVGAIEQAAEVGRAGPGPRRHEVERPPRHGQVRRRPARPGWRPGGRPRPGGCRGWPPPRGGGGSSARTGGCPGPRRPGRATARLLC